MCGISNFNYSTFVKVMELPIHNTAHVTQSGITSSSYTGLSKTELFSKVTELEGSVTEPNLFLIAMSD